MKRIFDLIIASVLLIILIIPFLFLALLIKLDSEGPIFYISKRIGQNKKIFKMIKFRTMHKGTPQVNSKDLYNPENYITKIGAVLRKLSIDELPQIINVLLGNMSLVGPRPALMDQIKLIEKRENLNINNLMPGITGLAQINGRDKISLNAKVNFDLIYKEKRSFLFDLKILIKTIYVAGKGKDVEH